MSLSSWYNTIHWGLGIRTVRIPRPPFCDSLKGHILSGQFDPRGLDIRTSPDTGAYSGSRYPDKKGKWFKGQLLSGQFDPRGLGIRTPVRIPRPRKGNLIQWFLHCFYRVRIPRPLDQITVQILVSRYPDSSSDLRTTVRIPRPTVGLGIRTFSLFVRIMRHLFCPDTESGRNRSSVYRDPSVLEHHTPWLLRSVQRCRQRK